jgi:hypothetical protein
VQGTDGESIARESHETVTSRWRRLAIIGASTGAGFAVMLALIFGVAFWYSSRPRPPKPWNTTAIKATFQDVTAAGNDNHLEFEYVLENTTDSDFRIGESSAYAIMGRLRNPSSLQGPVEGLFHLGPIFIPARQRVEYSVSVPQMRYDTLAEKYRGTSRQMPEQKPNPEALAAYVNKEFPNLDGFVLFDEVNRYQINFPKGW